MIRLDDKQYEWSPDKNEWLKENRGISFEEVLEALTTHAFVIDARNPNEKKYPNQHVLILKLRGYVHVVPYSEDNNKRFLKTIYPSRKATKLYLQSIKG